MILGIVGYNASGKDAVAIILEKNGFTHYSLSAIVKQKVNEKGIEPTRENLIQTGNELRLQNGSAVLAEKTGKLINENPTKDYVITSIRNPYEVESLKKEFKDNFHLIYINTDPKIRFERLRKRNRENDVKTFEQFIKTENMEKQNNDPNKQSIENCIEKAEYVIINEANIETLEKDMNKLLKVLRSENG